MMQFDKKMIFGLTVIANPAIIHLEKKQQKFDRNKGVSPRYWYALF